MFKIENDYFEIQTLR